MKQRSFTWKSVVFTFVIAAIFYALAYAWMTRRQIGRGPWQVAFTTNAAGVPQLIVAQPTLHISNVTVHFTGEQLNRSNSTGSVSFSKPQMPVPFCDVAYDDLMFQPGIVTLDCFGHLVELSPRALGLNGAARPWTNGVIYELSPSDRMSADLRRKLKGGYRR